MKTGLNYLFILDSPQVQKIKKIQEQNQIFGSNHDDITAQTKLCEQKKLSSITVTTESVANLKKANESKINVNIQSKIKIIIDQKSCEKKKEIPKAPVAPKRNENKENINVIKKQAKMEQCKAVNKTVLVDPGNKYFF